ncbi:MAG: TetR/AcrR family transcriptional regulator [Pleurocapsa sp. MO_226.B13]|nr:TetR/AcrR family transcriptional regulator [Pleurocapsa sp. MO_226.B13]
MSRKSQTYERLLKAAETQFIGRGYEAVTVKDIAKAAGIHHASIYHHIPGGKAELFVEVMTRHLNRHREGIQESLDRADNNLRSQLLAIALWLLSQPPMDLIRLTNSDLPAIDRESASQLDAFAYMTLMMPIEQILEQASARGEIAHPNLGNIAGAILSSIEGLHCIPEEYTPNGRQQMAEELIDVFIRGISRA